MSAPAHDVLIAGAGPAGCLAAIALARRGARVLLLDRASFPRDKLCGDTLNPGALAILRAEGLPSAERGLPIGGMLVTGPGGARAEACYPPGVTGRAIVRRELDSALLQAAAEAGAEIREATDVRSAIVGSSGRVEGLAAAGRGGREQAIAGRVVIACDGRESRIARGLSLARAPSTPRRWAVGAYFVDVDGVGSLGEMHVRPAHYIGVAPVPGGLVNVCVVTADRGRLRRQDALIPSVIASEPELTERFARARMVTRPVTLGPLAVDCPTPGMPGLLLAGDAAGFIDPMTGDGLRFALRGAQLAADEARRALETGDLHGHRRLALARHREFAPKWRFNRALRRLASSGPAVHLAALATRATAVPIARAVVFAGDVPRA